MPADSPCGRVMPTATKVIRSRSGRLLAFAGVATVANLVLGMSVVGADGGPPPPTEDVTADAPPAEPELEEGSPETPAPADTSPSESPAPADAPSDPPSESSGG